jgi:hypothetical protein
MIDFILGGLLGGALAVFLMTIYILQTGGF